MQPWAPDERVRTRALSGAASVLALALTAFPASRAHAAPAEASLLSLEQVSAGVYVHLGRQLPLDAPGHDDIANIGFIVGDRCVAVIDTGGSTRIGRALRAAVSRTTRKPVCYVINTHVHVDHVLGNAAFRDGQVRFAGHARLPGQMQRNRSFFLTQYAGDLDAPAGPGQIVPPDLTVSDSLSIDLGHRTLHLRAWPEAHTDCDLTVLDEKTRTLWTGDLLFMERLPALDGDVAGWLGVIDSLAALEVARVVPGHGRPTQDLRGGLDLEREYLRLLLSDVRQAQDAGASLQQSIESAAQSQRSNWLLWDSTHPRNVTRVYERLEWQ